LPLEAHSPTAIKAIAPTCTEDGCTEGLVCSVCDTVISEPLTLSATGHSAVKTDGKAPTCTEDGYTESEICSVCNTVIIESQPLKALEHTVVTIEAKAPTCTEEGHTDSEVCSTCGTVIREAQTVSALGHATVTVKGKAATCTKDGKTDKTYCSRCDEVLAESEVIPALGHSEKTVKGVSATCTKEGLTSSVVCSVCKVTLTPAETIAPLGHNAVTVAATQPTCTLYGISEHLGCSRCGISLSEFITTEPLGHTSVTVSGAEPTCTRRGYSESTKCSVCNAVLTEPVYSDPLGHKFSDNTCTVCSALADDSLNLPTKYYGLYEADTLKMICEKNADRRIEPASITKLLAAATALKYLPQDTVMKTGTELYLVNLELGRAYLEVGKEMTLYDLLIALLLPSGSDAAYTIAVHVAREVSGNPNMKYAEALKYFTELMNDYALEIGATSSHFMNPVGEPNDKHYTTISDLALIVSYIRKTYPTINEITSSYRRTVNYLNGGSSTWTNTNYLLNPKGSFYHPNAIGMKTGTADNAGYCLCAVFDINGKEYIAIIMGCKNNTGRYGSAHKLISLVE
jgi:D-alanyl-D-alanine carboxypeptidase